MSMFLIPLILTAGLDMSLPEFQPQPDLSGNVIVGSFDKEDPVDVMPLEDISINDILKDDVTDNDKKSVSDNDSKKSSDVSLNDKVKDSGGKSAGSGTKSEPSRANPVVPDGYETVYLSVYQQAGIKPNSYTPFPIEANANSGVNYVILQPGYTYYLTTNSTNIKFAPNLNIGTNTYPIQGQSTTYVPNETTYALVSFGYEISGYYFSPISSGDDITGNDYTAVVEGLAVINENITEINDKLDDLSSAGADDLEVLDRHTQLFRAMLLCLLITFLYPITLSIVRNIVGGDSNV